MKRRNNSDAKSQLAPSGGGKTLHDSRKERIDAALARYTTETSPQAAAPAAVPHEIPEAPTQAPPPPVASAAETDGGGDQAHTATALVIPTNPESDAAIPAAAAERARERAAAEAAAREKQFDVVPATFVETPLNRRLIYTLLAAWLGAVPVALIIYALTSAKVSGVLGALISAVEYLLAIYSLLGWVPLMVLYIKRRNH